MSYLCAFSKNKNPDIDRIKNRKCFIRHGIRVVNFRLKLETVDITKYLWKEKKIETSDLWKKENDKIKVDVHQIDWYVFKNNLKWGKLSK